MVEAAEEQLDRLMELVGLSLQYEDVFGKMRGPDLDARRALLQGLGYDVGDHQAVSKAIGELEKTDKRHIPSVVVAWVPKDAERATVHIPVAPAGVSLTWQLKAYAETQDNIPASGDITNNAVSWSLPPGLYRVTLEGCGIVHHATIVVAPDACYLTPLLENGTPVWGIAVQIYSLRSSRNWGIGDYSDLTAIAIKAARAGADLIGINPIHARSLFRPEDASPYAPVSRFCLDTLAIDVEAVPELGIAGLARQQIGQPRFQEKLRRLRQMAYVDYSGVAEIKLRVLRLLHDAFLTSGSRERHRRFSAFIEAGGASLRSYAEFEAVRAVRQGNEEPEAWWDWPETLRERQSGAFSTPALEREVAFQLYLQFEANEQLEIAAAAARAAGMTIGIYRDLAVASARDGAEAWERPDLVSNLTVGAAPDAFSETGQNWGLPATNPHILIEEDFKTFAALIASNMKEAGALRLDHAMALQRLFVIPEGCDGRAGTFLAFPLEAMTAVVALQSRREKCLVIGEDLGSVPKGFGEEMAKRRILAYKIVTFEVENDGRLRSPQDYPYLACAMFSTHDMPTIAGYWEGRDIDARLRAGQFTQSAAEQARQARRDEQAKLFDLLKTEGLAIEADDSVILRAAFADAIHLILARSGAAIAMAQLDDMLEELDAVNLPGTSMEYPNWRRKVHLDLESAEFGQAFERTASLFRSARPRKGRMTRTDDHPP